MGILKNGFLVVPLLGKSIIKKSRDTKFCASILFHDQFVADAAHIDDADGVVFGEFVAELCDEDMQAALVEEGVVAPKIEEDVLHIHHLIAVEAKVLQYFRFAIGEFLALVEQ